MTSLKLIVIIFAMANFSLASSYWFPAGAARKMSTAPQIGTAIKIGVIKDSESFDGGCFLQLPDDYSKRNERYIFISDLGDRGLMNIDGKDTKLSLVSYNGDLEGKQKQGDRSTYTYSGRGLKVSVEYLVTSVCDPDDEACEATSYDATITVTTAGGRRTVKVKGVCGP